MSNVTCNMKQLCATLLTLLISMVVQSNYGCASYNCTISAPTLNFGVYDLTAVLPTKSQSNITVTCSGFSLSTIFSPYMITLSTGQSGSYTNRTMNNVTSKMNYNLYIDLANTTVWGDGSGSTAIKSGTPSLTAPSGTYTVYGQIPARQGLPAGAYSDAIIMTVNF